MIALEKHRPSLRDQRVQDPEEPKGRTLFLNEAVLRSPHGQEGIPTARSERVGLGPGAGPNVFRIREPAMQPEPQVRQYLWDPQMLAVRCPPGASAGERLTEEGWKRGHLRGQPRNVPGERMSELSAHRLRAGQRGQVDLRAL